MSSSYTSDGFLNLRGCAVTSDIFEYKWHITKTFALCDFIMIQLILINVNKNVLLTKVIQTCVDVQRLATYQRW